MTTKVITVVTITMNKATRVRRGSSTSGITDKTWLRPGEVRSGTRPLGYHSNSPRHLSPDHLICIRSYHDFLIRLINIINLLDYTL